VENDDRPSLYSTKDLMEVFKRTGVPIVHDFHHHHFNTGGLSNKDALLLACSTWGTTTPVTHYSQSRAVEHNDASIKANAHSDSYWIPVDTYGQDVDVMLECKHKELGLFKMRELLSKTI
jgi:UV DNA damage endonuclease